MSARRLGHPPALVPLPPREPPGILVVPRDTIVDDTPPVFEIEAPRVRVWLWLFAAVLVLIPPAASTYAIIVVQSDAPSAKDARLARHERPVPLRAPRVRSR